MRIDHANSRRRAPRPLGIAALLLAILVVMLVSYSGGASAAPPADLSITKMDSPDPVVQGDSLTYTIRVTNGGPNAATDVLVTDNLPAGSDVDFVSATSTAGSCQRAGNAVTCNLGTVANGANETVTIVVQAKKSGTISNTAIVASPDDLNSMNNTAPATTTVMKKGGQKPGKKPTGKASCATPTMVGTAGNDVITGTSAGDVIVTHGGNDQVFAGGGGDLICSGAGADEVFGQDGGDTVIAGGGPDLANGGKSGDVLKGKAGRDRLKGKSGNDLLNGGKNRDSCKGGSGRDTLKRCP
jgi:uncharacterized repeat protein (TIGR01451 family)